VATDVLPGNLRRTQSQHSPSTIVHFLSIFREGERRREKAIQEGTQSEHVLAKVKSSRKIPLNPLSPFSLTCLLNRYIFIDGAEKDTDNSVPMMMMTMLCI